MGYENVPRAITIQEARDIVRAHVKVARVETVPLEEAVGRVLAADCVSDIDVAPFDDSAMDGFAVIAADLAAATAQEPCELACVGYIGAGAYFPETLTTGQCVRIMTGAPVPAGATAVVRIEDAVCAGKGMVGETISFAAPVREGANIRFAGEEARAGEAILHAGDVIRPAGIGLLASCGCLNVQVYARPVVGIMCIGSELVHASEIPGPGMIRDSNSWAMQAYVREAGGLPRLYPRVADDVDAIRELFAQMAQECDVVVSTGGACMGDYDLTPDIVASLGELYFTRVSVKPGKSQPFGRIGQTPVFVLSGNPGASSMGFELYVRLALRIMQGYTDNERPVVTAKLAENAPKNESRVFLQRGLLSRGEDGALVASQLQNQSSALFGSFQAANCYIVIPEGTAGLRAGDNVECILTSVDEGLY